MQTKFFTQPTQKRLNRTAWLIGQRICTWLPNLAAVPLLWDRHPPRAARGEGQLPLRRLSGQGGARRDLAIPGLQLPRCRSADWLRWFHEAARGRRESMRRVRRCRGVSSRRPANTALRVDRGIRVARATSACLAPRASISAPAFRGADYSAWDISGLVLLDQSRQDLDQFALAARRRLDTSASPRAGGPCGSPFAADGSWLVVQQQRLVARQSRHQRQSFLHSFLLYSACVRKSLTNSVPPSPRVRVAHSHDQAVIVPACVEE